MQNYPACMKLMKSISEISMLQRIGDTRGKMLFSQLQIRKNVHFLPTHVTVTAVVLNWPAPTAVIVTRDGTAPSVRMVSSIGHVSRLANISSGKCDQFLNHLSKTYVLS